MKNISIIIHHNVMIYLVTQTNEDKTKYEYIKKRVDSGEQITLKDIFNWCDAQDIYYETKFFYKKDYTLKANTWNFYSYLRAKIEWNLRKVIDK